MPTSLIVVLLLVVELVFEQHADIARFDFVSIVLQEHGQRIDEHLEHKQLHIGDHQREGGLLQALFVQQNIERLLKSVIDRLMLGYVLQLGELVNAELQMKAFQISKNLFLAIVRIIDIDVGHVRQSVSGQSNVATFCVGKRSVR